jgi:hypothetical protein
VFDRAGTDAKVFEANKQDLLEAIGTTGLRNAIDLCNTTEMESANGAYAQEGPNGHERIYINADWINAGNLSLEQLTAMVLEEFGSALDVRLNADQIAAINPRTTGALCRWTASFNASGFTLTSWTAATDTYTLAGSTSNEPSPAAVRRAPSLALLATISSMVARVTTQSMLALAAPLCPPARAKALLDIWGRWLAPGRDGPGRRVRTNPHHGLGKTVSRTAPGPRGGGTVAAGWAAGLTARR